MFGNLAQDNMRAAGKARKEFTYLEPLFISYNNKIEIQEKLISESQESLREMEKKSDFLIQENRTLRDQLEDKYMYSQFSQIPRSYAYLLFDKHTNEFIQRRACS